jgi:hypothetical protein
MNNKKAFFGGLIIFFCITVFSQNDSTQNVKKYDFFSNIYPSFSATYSKKEKPWYGFEMNTAQIGFRTIIKKNIQGIILYNVTKTTSDISVFDTSNNSLMVQYFKGSDFTAFLKQAEIILTLSEKLELSMGQILSEQYLKVQDKFWDLRYVALTMQEIYKFGHPADFGFSFSYKLGKFRFTSTISNGEGPFYKQDKNGLILYAVNAEYRPNKSLIIKWYSNVYPNQNKYSWTHNFFTGFKTEKLKIGAEGTIIYNQNWIYNNNHSGISVFTNYKLNNTWSVFFREDYILKNNTLKDFSLSIFGFQFKYDESLLLSINQRLIKQNNNLLWQTFLSAGFKF